MKINSLAKARLVAGFASDKKAEGLKILDVRRMSSFCDFFVIANASSDRRAQAIADNIGEGLKNKGISVRSKEADSASSWILLDIYDVVAHIFTGTARKTYNLEKLWQGAKVVSASKKKHARKQSRRPPKRTPRKRSRRSI